MIDMTKETLLSLPQAAALLPPGRAGRPVSKSTLIDWIDPGTKGPAGELVRLEAVRCGRRWLTSREALARFMARLTPDLTAESVASSCPVAEVTNAV
jgi:hypothetical protein